MNQFSRLGQALVIFLSTAIAGCGSNAGSMMPTGNAGKISPDIFQQKVNGYGWTFTDLQAQPLDIVADPNHKMWATENNGILEIAMDKHVNTFTLAVQPGNITIGSDKNLWVTASTPGSSPVGMVARVTPTGGETDFAVTVGMFPRNIASGPDGALWFDECTQDKSAGGVGTITTSGTYAFYSNGVGCPQDIAAGPDGNIWFGNGPTMFSMTTQGQIVGQYAVGDRYVSDITTGSDGALWVIERPTIGGSRLMRITTQGQITHFDSGFVCGCNATLTNIVSGPDGNLWIMVGGRSNHLVTFDPTTQTRVASVKAPTYGRLAVGLDDNIWMAGLGDSRIDTYVRMLMTLSTKKLTVPVGQNANVNVSEANYSGRWTAIAKDPKIASVTLNSQNGSFVITGVSPGTTFVAVYDSMFNSVEVKVTVQ
jgi:streptogramin lyase